MLNPRSMVDFSSAVDVLFVKTDLNLSFSILAFSLLSLVIEPLCLSGAMHILSCLLALAYLQNGFRSFFSRPSVMILLAHCVSALGNCFLHFFYVCLYSVHCLDFLAGLCSLTFLLTILLKLFVIQGKLLFLLKIFDGMFSSMAAFSFRLNVFQIVLISIWSFPFDLFLHIFWLFHCLSYPSLL